MNLFLLLIFLLPFAEQSAETPLVTWLAPTEHDFGLLSLGKRARIDFTFRNQSAEPLIIDNVRTSCGCTATEWPREPIPAGATAGIAIEFHARQKGYFYKPIKVYFRGQRKAERLVVSGEVE